MKSEPTLIRKPLLAATLEDPQALVFPCLVTPKIDGIRALRIGNEIVSRTFKPIRNKTIQMVLSELLPVGSDGEITVGTTFQDASRGVMSSDGTENFSTPFTFHWFDYVSGDPTKPYEERMQDMKRYLLDHPEILAHPQATIIPLYPLSITNVNELVAYETDVLARGYEGVMIRKANGPYKMGRSSVREGILLKLKKFSDAEARILGVEELMHNENEKKPTELGKDKRTSHKKGLVASGKMGSLHVENLADEICFNIGTGFTDQMRTELWEQRDKLPGQIVKYKYFEQGVKVAPRFPVFLAFRDRDDM